MNLGTLIARLEREPADKIVMEGFGEGMSYRGYYDEVAFAPQSSVTVGEMLAHAREALGKTMTGYKGGEYLMTAGTKVNIAEYGACGEEDDLNRWRLDAMLNSSPAASENTASARSDKP